MKNLASSLFLTEREPDSLDPNAPKVRGRIVTTLEKAKEVRPLVERSITVVRRVLPQKAAADRLLPGVERGTAEWKRWRSGPQWQEWAKAMGPVVAARRQLIRMLGDKQAVQIVFDVVAPRFADRPGGYTRVLRLATPRLGDAGTRAILEFVGVNDRKAVRGERPAFETQAAPGE